MSDDPTIAPTDKETMTVTVTFPCPRRFDNQDLCNLYTQMVEALTPLGFAAIDIRSGYRASVHWQEGSSPQVWQGGS
jgi:hypothetical protein